MRRAVVDMGYDVDTSVYDVNEPEISISVDAGDALDQLPPCAGLHVHSAKCGPPYDDQGHADG